MATFDRRYPHMFPLDGRALPHISAPDAKKIRGWASRIASRTGLKAFYNARLGNVLFSLTDEPFGGPITVPVFKNHQIRTVSETEIDDMVRMAGMARMSRAQKDKILAHNKQLESWEKEDKTNALLAERRPDAISYAAFRDRKRRGVEKVHAVAQGV